MKFLLFFIFTLLSILPLQSIGTVIVLHGTGSSGKTSISKFLQKKLQNCISISIDDFFWPALIENGIKRKLIKKSMTREEQMHVVIDHRALLSSDLQISKTFKDLYEEVQLLAQEHSFVILDVVFANKSEYYHFCEAMKDIPFFSVLVYCSPIKLAEHVIHRNTYEKIQENRDIFSHMKNFLKFYKKSNDPDTILDTISQQEVFKALEIVTAYAKQAHIKRSLTKEKMKMLHERFEQKFFNKNNAKVSIKYLFEYDIMVNTGKMSSMQCVDLIYEKLIHQEF